MAHTVHITYTVSQYTVATLPYFICLLTVVTAFYYLRSLFYGQFFYLFDQSFSKPPIPTHNRLFSVTNIWRNTFS